MYVHVYICMYTYHVTLLITHCHCSSSPFLPSFPISPPLPSLLPSPPRSTVCQTFSHHHCVSRVSVCPRVVQEGRRLTFSKRKVIASVEDLDEFDQFLLEKVSVLTNIMQHRAYVVHLLEAIIWEGVVWSPHMEAYVRTYVRMYMGVCSIRMFRLKELSSVANTNENSIICTAAEHCMPF